MKLRRKLVVSVSTAALLATVFTTATFAWIPVNSVVYVDNFQLTAIAGDGFMVSVDGENFSNSLSKIQLYQAMYHTFNDDTVFEDGKLYTVVQGSDSKELVSDSTLSDFVRRIELYPLTSTDGISMKDVYDAGFGLNTKKYMEFSVYFKAVSDKPEDNQNFEIYLNGEDVENPDTGDIVPKTLIKANDAWVDLRTGMMTWKSDAILGEKVHVTTSNALRMSVIESKIDPDEGNYVASSEKATIYELTDSNDLGSYATNYSGSDEELTKLYDSTQNAMFTYYNALNPYSQLTALEYDKKPQTIRALDSDAPYVTTVQSYSQATKVTFRFWLEGWDADCFDGLTESINVRLSFVAKKVDGTYGQEPTTKEDGE